MTKGQKKLVLVALLFSLALIMATVNWFYQAYHKPAEIVGLVDSKFFRDPKSTWSAYGPQFQEFSTNIMTPDFLAALAQLETGGNAIARTSWRWNLGAKHVFDVYSPASSAVGMYQMTNGTFKVAKHFCIRGNKAARGCDKADSYNRLSPSDSIEMTSAYLHWNVTQLLKKHRKLVKHVTLEKKQDLAAVIHLCGVGRGAKFVKHKFHFRRGEKCGASSPRQYVAKLHKYQRIFAKLGSNLRLSRNQPQHSRFSSPKPSAKEG